MNVMKIKCFAIIAVLLSNLAIGSAIAQNSDIKERTLRFAYVQPKSSHMGFGVEKFAELVAKKSGNKITVKGYADGSLGGDLNVLTSLQGGTIDMTTMPPSLMVGQAKVYGAFSIHFLFGDFKEADTVLDGPVGKKFLEKAPKGVVGSNHSIAIRTNGSMWSWGLNSTGELGINNVITTRSSPVSVVGGFTDWCQVCVNGSSSFALRTNGTLWAWGSNTTGQLGDNTTVSKSSPVSVVGGFTDWCQVSGGVAIRQTNFL